MRILVTGANGFVGQRLCTELILRGVAVRAAGRSSSIPIAISDMAVVDSIDGETDWSDALHEVDIVIHLAARVHVMEDTATDPLVEFLKINTQGTANLARQAAAAVVKRLVYVSSIKVNGEQTGEAQAFTETDTPNPQDAYAVSKWQAEQALHGIAHETGLEVVIVRPPLVYGPNVKGNFIRLLAAVDRGIPLPLAGVRNQRSMLYLDNLVDALITCASHPSAAGRTYLVRDGEDVSIPELVRQIAAGLGRSPRLFHIPVALLRGMGDLFGRPESTDRILSSLCVNDDLIRKELGWRPAFTLPQGMQATTGWYKTRYKLPSMSLEKRHAASHCNTSVVIVNYNAGEILLECVAAAHQQAEQIIVVDNASADNSIAALRYAFPDVQLVCNERNLGFATACNQGAQIADGNHLLFLNPDCVLKANAIDVLVAAVHSVDSTGVAGGLLTDVNGVEQAGGRRTIPTPWRSFVRGFGLSALCKRYPKLFADYELHKQPLPDHPVEVEAISGACMLARRDALEEVGLLDEGYFMHCEDLDWCMRFRQKGWKILFVPDAQMIHHKGHCSKSRPVFVEWSKHKGMIRFYRKFFRYQYPGVLMGLVVVGVWLRFSVVAAHSLLNKISSRSVFGGG